MNFPFLVIAYISFLEWVLVSRLLVSFPSLPLNTLLPSCCDSSLTLIKASGCRTLTSLRYFHFPPVLLYFWLPACKAVMIFNFWEFLLSCLSFNYKYVSGKFHLMFDNTWFSTKAGVKMQIYDRNIFSYFHRQYYSFKKSYHAKGSWDSYLDTNGPHLWSFVVYFVSFIVQILVPCMW